MEPKSTKGSNKKVPGQEKKTSFGNLNLGSGGYDLSDFGSFTEFEIPEIPAIPEIPDFSSYMDDSMKKMEQAMKDTEKWFAEQGVKFDMFDLSPVNFNIDTDVKEYTDGDGYHVIEGRTKDGYVYIQRTKRSGNKTITKFEGYKDGGIIYKANSDEDKVTYRGLDGKMIEIARTEKKSNSFTTRDRVERSWSKDYSLTIRTPHATVIKRKKKKTTNIGKWLLIIAIAAVVIYYVFLR